MTRLETLIDIRDTLSLLFAQRDEIDDEPDVLALFKESYESLLNQFYKDTQDLMAPQQYEAAKKDFEYFMRLVKLAIAYEKSKTCADVLPC